MTEAVQYGFDPDWLLSLDFISFDSLMGSITRNHYRHLIETSIANQIAAQGDSKTMKKYVKDLTKLTRTGLRAIGSDAKALKALLAGKGGI